jgi:hypothetical protein
VGGRPLSSALDVMANSAASVVVELPNFDTGEYEGCGFVMSNGGAELTIHIAGQSDFRIAFRKVRWHQFTALPNCTPEMVRDAYFRLISDRSSAGLARFISNDRSSAKAYSQLAYFRIFLDETGCHEMYAESANAV